MLKFTAFFCLMLAVILVAAQNQPLLKLRYEENYTPTYDEVIEMYQKLDSHFENAVLLEKGLTDCGKPLHLFVINNSPEFDEAKIREQRKAVLLINNGIHPGEPAGIDASLQFADDILRNKDGMAEILENAVIIIIPVYSIGGHLNRSAYNRSGQTTPFETGFRGNYANLDLNRDFTKADSENARSFYKIFTEWNPDVFLDTHTTNGSDHQYSITLVQPPSARFPKKMETYLEQTFIPALYREMKKGKYELIPYVDYFYHDPKHGIARSLEGPRYSSGFASMFHTIGMMTENEIYKAYPDRVKSCYQFIQMLAEYTSEKSSEIQKIRVESIRESMELTEYPIGFEMDSTKFQMIEFKGYEAVDDQISQVTGLPRFGYDLSQPYTTTIKYLDSWIPAETVEVPEFYILPQNYRDVIERLDLLNIQYSRLQNDSLVEVTVDYIEEFTSPPQPYNGHFYHSSVVTRNELQKMQYYKGDLLIPVRQEKIKYLLEMFEPKAVDSFFRWNFFDNILDQREYFSSYGFEENALKYLEEHPDFKARFLEARQKNSVLATNHRAQLAWIYNNSEWLEKSWKRYPVGRIFN
ncbi:M14 family zinc carboxypeptidase [Mariniphaga sp.]|uniref:M14 family zinc carboxypeptidase n=1 Tax=Mariniphaga sp. TaxID=1954475 RepID=UPI003565BF31